MRIALGLEYDGSNFSGWQSQTHVRAIQPCVEDAVSRVAAQPVKVFCAGRTDAGVHACGQVVHFETESVRSARAWTLGTNANLPPDVSVLWAQPVPATFNARFSAIARVYRYVIANRATRVALWARKMTWECRPLDVEKMARAARYLLGEHDFSSFRAAGCQALHPVRTIRKINVARDRDLIVVDVEANAFLQHMVRNIVGVLLGIGRGERPVEWMAELLLARDRNQGGMTAPPGGLYFMRVEYAAQYQLPPNPAWRMPLG
jgi:tRNA pseudouridine38-40 synthase